MQKHFRQGDKVRWRDREATILHIIRTDDVVWYRVEYGKQRIRSWALKGELRHIEKTLGEKYAEAF